MLMFAVLARERARLSSLLLLSLLVLTCHDIERAHADGVKATIGNGLTVNGTLTGEGLDTYSFKVTAGSSFIVSVGETGPHNPAFVPELDLAAPGTGEGRGSARVLYARLEEMDAAEGTWSVKVSRADKGVSPAGTYALTLIQVPGAFAAGGIAAAAMSAGANNSGSTNRGKVEVWTFSGIAGRTETLTLNHTGTAGVAPEIYVFTPTGGFAGGFNCSKSCSQDVPTPTSGVYTVIAFKNDANDITATYTLSVNDKN